MGSILSTPPQPGQYAGATATGCRSQPGGSHHGHPAFLPPDRPKIIKNFQGSSKDLHKIFPKLTHDISLDNALVLMIDSRSLLGAFTFGVLFLFSLAPFAGSVLMFVKNGISWSDIGFLAVVIICLAYLVLWNCAFFRNFCYFVSARYCFICFSDRVVWAEKWLSNFKSETFLYDNITEISHGYLNGGGEAGRGLYIDDELLFSDTRRDGITQWLYLLLKKYASGHNIQFKDIDHQCPDPSSLGET